MSTTYSAGIVTAYGAAKQAGYTGTYNDFCTELANIAGISATATTLAAGSSATASYSNGVLSLGIPKGDQGIQGVQGEQGVQGVQGETGNGIQSVYLTGTAGLVDTYTILFTDGTTTEFNITNGQDGEVTQAQLDTTNAEVSALKSALNALDTALKSGSEADAVYHLGFYLDSNGDLCQVEEDA